MKYPTPGISNSHFDSRLRPLSQSCQIRRIYPKYEVISTNGFSSVGYLMPLRAGPSPLSGTSSECLSIPWVQRLIILLHTINSSTEKRVPAHRGGRDSSLKFSNLSTKPTVVRVVGLRDPIALRFVMGCDIRPVRQVPLAMISLTFKLQELINPDKNRICVIVPFRYTYLFLIM